MSRGGGSTNSRGSTARPSGGQRTATNPEDPKARTTSDDPLFRPGFDGSFSWNTTVPTGTRPILLYVFNCEATAGPELEFSRKLEKAFTSEGAIELSRQFTCEKVCLEKEELFRPLPHRSALDRLLASLKDQAPKPMLVVVDPMGEVIAKTDKPLDTFALQAFMKKALNESKQHVDAAKAGSSDPP
jgi:hypothetical protein